ncbi:MAG: bifunctional phosphoglucose/phosphomannose isomerase [Candidatus Omnitrophica bacterium]|nr:bifunctional phosphoglucose/phosphomannose isomerase [Candidatus Omnitrophota bacterium]
MSRHPGMNLPEEMKGIRRIDRSDMLSRVAALPEQCRQGWRLGIGWNLPASYRRSGHLLVLGMGGSAIGGDLLQGLAEQRMDRPITVNRSYHLPRWVNRHALVLACSYSGNTEETLAASREAVQRGARVIALTSGGRLAAWSRRLRLPLLMIPSGLPPRAAVGYAAFAPLGLLVRLGWLQARAFPLEEACDPLEEFIRCSLAPAVPVPSNPAKRLALRLKGRLPILYGASGGWEGITYRWRTQLEENAKTVAFHHLFPEATHNEISGWVEPRPVIRSSTALFLMDPAIHPRTRRRMEFTGRIIRSRKARVEFVQVPGRSGLERKLKLVALGDFVSVYLSLLYRIDPTPVKRVEALKRWLR